MRVKIEVELDTDSVEDMESLQDIVKIFVEEFREIKDKAEEDDIEASLTVTTDL